MKRLLLSLVFNVCLFGFSQTPKNIGKWYGEVNLNGQGYPVVLFIYEDSIKVNNKDAEEKASLATEYYFSSDSIYAYWSQLNATLNSTLINEDTIVSKFEQMGQQFDVSFSRNPIQPKQYARPQTPKPPYSYDTSAVEIPSLNEKFNLSGTLIPINEEVAVIFASGSGPQNRNSTIMKHHPFWVISDYLAQNNISSLRMDDRGIGASGGNFQKATTADFAEDIVAAAKYLHKKGFKKIGILGHSEGGLIAPLAASQSKYIDFLILLAPPGVTGDAIIRKQSKLILKQKGVAEEKINTQNEQVQRLHQVILSTEDYQDTLRNTLEEIYDEALSKGEQLPEKNAFIMQNMLIYSSPWYRYFISYDPIPVLKKLKIPVGVIQGERDIQVDADQNVPPIKAALKKGKCKQYKIQRIEGLNHLLQESETGAVDEYINIEQTISPVVLELIVKWTQEFSK